MVPRGANPIQSGTWEYHRKHYGADFDYRDFARQFRAELFHADHWAEVFQRFGAKYVVPTSKHHEGFALWPSREASRTWGRPWNAVEIGPKRDLLGELTRAVRARGLKMGFYYSLYEWYNPLWLSDRLGPGSPGHLDPANSRTAHTAADQTAYRLSVHCGAAAGVETGRARRSQATASRPEISCGS